MECAFTLINPRTVKVIETTKSKTFITVSNILFPNLLCAMNGTEVFLTMNHNLFIEESFFSDILCINMSNTNNNPKESEEGMIHNFFVLVLFF